MSRPAQGGASLRAVLALPHARGLFLAGALARLPYGLLPLPLLLALRDAGGSYAVAGTVVGAFSLVSAVLGPYRARLVERRPATLPWLAGGFAALLGAVAVLAAVRAGWGAALLAPVAALLAPPVGPLVRARWGVLARGDAERQAALSLDAAAESTVFALGPAFAGALLSALAGPAVLGLCAACFALGFLALTAAFGRVPAPAAASATVPSPAEASAADASGAEASAAEVSGAEVSADGAATAPPARVPLRSVAFLSVLVAVLAVGASLTLAELAVVAAWGAGAAGPLLALCSVGGVLGGLGYGRRAWRRSPHDRLTLLAAGAAACQALCALSYAPGGVAVGLFLGGAAADCVLITAYLLVEELVPEGARTEGGAWVNTAWNLGVAGGSGLAGLLLAGSAGAREVFACGAVLLLAVTVPLVLRRRSQRRSGRRSEPLPAGV